MPEYLAPGVYVEETSFRSKSIEGVSTSTAGFVGPARFGPINGEPQLVTSFGEFERIYGGLDALVFETEGRPSVNHLAQAARAFFENGGRRLYVCRIYQRAGTASGQASAVIGTAPQITLTARHPGVDGRLRVRFTLRYGRNSLVMPTLSPPAPASLKSVGDNDTVLIESPGGSVPVEGLFRADRLFDDATGTVDWQFVAAGGGGSPIALAQLATDPAASVRVLTVNVEIAHVGADGNPERAVFFEGLGFDPEARLSLSQTFAAVLASASQQAAIPLIFATSATDGPTIAAALIDALPAESSLPSLSDADNRTLVVSLSTGGSDGDRPAPDLYTGEDQPRSGLVAFEDLADISIVAAPGSTVADLQTELSQAIVNALISHCERMRYRVGVIDSREGDGLSDVRDFRAKFDTTHAAFYYPWIRSFDPFTRREANFPPSGFIAGIYARNDIEKGVHKAPANEVVRLATGFEVLVNQRQQDVLNSEHINVLRFFEGRGFRVWGARILSSDPEWKYVNVRRYFAYLERSIDRGTQFAVFENNGPRLWANIRRTVEDFLYNEWVSGRLFGLKPAEAFFVRCDLSTMTQNDLDNGRLICLIGVAVLKPAEYVIFRIGQFTAISRS